VELREWQANQKNRRSHERHVQLRLRQARFPQCGPKLVSKTKNSVRNETYQIDVGVQVSVSEFLSYPHANAQPHANDQVSQGNCYKNSVNILLHGLFPPSANSRSGHSTGRHVDVNGDLFFSQSFLLIISADLLFNRACG